MTHPRMRIGIIGCGFVADLYMQTLRRHAALELLGAWDRDAGRLYGFSRCYAVPAYASVDDLLEDARIETVLNLTNPHSHYEVSRRCLLAGKHVYSEKPLAMNMEHARELVALAEARGLRLSGAPSRLLGRPAQTLWKALRQGRIGQPYLAYAEMDDGLLHRMGWARWRGASGAGWPYQDELRVGNTLEHAGYALTWLTAFFGPARSVTAFGARAVTDKRMGVPLQEQAPDVSIAGIEFASGVVARLTCSIIGRHDHRIRVFGEEGELCAEDCWLAESPVRLRRRIAWRGRSVEAPLAQRLPLLGDREARQLSKGRSKVDFCLGPTELARALAENRPSRLTAAHGLHITELSLAISQSMTGAARVALTTRFDPPEPMPWAR